MVDFRIDIVVDPRRAEPGVRQTEKRLGSLDKRAKRVGATIRRTAAALGGGFLAVSAVRNLARFEQSLSTVQAVTGATGEEFERLRDRARELGATTRFTATQAGDALVNLSRAGFSVQEALETVDDTLALAQAGGLDLASASDIAASAIRGFRIEAEEATRVVDVLTLTANSANTNVQQLGEAIKFVAPVAAGLGLSIEQTSAALGTLSDAGLKATLAGTGLRRVLAELESPSANSQKILAQLGVTADQVRVSQVGLVDALKALQQQGIDTGTALELFGQRGGPAFEVLVNNIPRLEQFTEQLNNAGGTAAEVAEIMDDNLNGALLRVKSALEAVNLSLGEAGGSDALTSSLNGLATVLRFVADNGEEALAVLAPLIGLIAVKGTASFLGFGAALAKFNPLLLAGTATISAVSFAFSKLRAEVDAAQKAFKNLEEDARFTGLGAEISTAQRELNKLNRAAEEQGFFSDSQRARVDQLTNAIAAARERIRALKETQDELNAAQEQNKTSVENSLAALDRRAALLQLNNQESRTATELEAELQKLLAAGIVAKDADRKALEERLKLIQSLELQAQLFNEIKGPQDEFNRRQAALNALLQAGRITAEEFRAKLAELRGEVDNVDVNESFAEGVSSLEKQNELLSVRLALGEEAAQRRQLEQQLEEELGTLTEAQKQRIADLVKENRDLNAALRERAELEKKVTDETKKREKLAERERQATQALIERITPMEQLLEKERELKELLRKRPDLAPEIQDSLEDVRLRQLELAKDLGAGFELGFLKAKQEAQDFSVVGTTAINSFVDNGTDAILDFVNTGKFEFKEFANSLVQDLLRVTIRLLILQGLTGGITGAGSLVGGLFGGARQDGGTVQPDRSFIVGERGPELFIPNRTGTVVPNAASQPQAAPVVQPQIVNVIDPNLVNDAIAGGGADDVIVNAIERNSERVAQVVK